MPKNTGYGGLPPAQNGWDYSDSEDDDYDPVASFHNNGGHLDSIDDDGDVDGNNNWKNDDTLNQSQPSPQPHPTHDGNEDGPSGMDDSDENDIDEHVDDGEEMGDVDGGDQKGLGNNNNNTNNTDPSMYPTNSNPDLIISPSIEEMQSYSEEELAQLDGLRIDHQRYGYVQWLAPVDVRYIDFGVSISFDDSGFEIYPQYPDDDEDGDDNDDMQRAPGPGEGINGPAQIAIFNCYPSKPLSTQLNDDNVPIPQQITVCSNGNSYLTSRLDQFEQSLKQSMKETGGEFISYDRIAGIWSFVVGSF